MPIYHGGTEISAGAIKIGGADVSAVFWGDIQVWPPGLVVGGYRLLEDGIDRRALENGTDLRVTEDAEGRTFSPEVQAVLDRMTNLTTPEIDAIEAFVDGSVADGNWGRIDDFWCFALNGTDWLTGWKQYTAFVDGNQNITRTDDGARVTDNGSQIETTMQLDLLTFYQLGDAEVGVFVHQIDSFGTNDADFFGIQTDIGNYRTRLRHVGDTEVPPNMEGSINASDPFVNVVTLAEMQKTLFSLREDGLQAELLINGSPDTTTGTPGTNVPDRPFGMWVFRCNDAGSGQRGSRPSTVTSFYVGAILNTAAFYNRLTTLHTALGVS